MVRYSAFEQRILFGISGKSVAVKNSVLALIVLSAIACVARAEPAAEPALAAPTVPEACSSFKEFVATACPLTWHGITLYGAYDVGVGSPTPRTTAYPGAPIRRPVTVRARARPSMTNSMPVPRPRIPAR